MLMDTDRQVPALYCNRSQDDATNFTRPGLPGRTPFSGELILKLVNEEWIY